jgi:hypothetical protein
MTWYLWKRGTVDYEVSGVEPVLAQWQASTHPAEIRLRQYVSKLVQDLSPLPDRGPLYLHMDIDIREQERLLRHYDLENYLTPLFGRRWLPPERFVLVSARKYIGGGSRVLCGLAEQSSKCDETSWFHFSHEAGSGYSTPRWKAALRAALAASGPSVLPPGPAKTRIAWRCSSRRNWANLWKPTGDAMGPVLGCSDPRNPFNPHDDRIVDLELHLNLDDSLRHDVVVGIWWTPGTIG